MPINPDKAYHQLIDAGEEWADAEAAASLLEETRRSFRSTLMADAMDQGIKSVAAAETHAEATKAYKDHVTNMVEARRVANRAKVKWIATQTLGDLRRSEEATRRAEMKV